MTERALLTRLRRLNTERGLVEAGDRILVACSGGKDSWALLHLLVAYRKVVPFGFELRPMTLDQKQPGFDAAPIVAHTATLGLEHHVEVADTYSVVKDKTPPGKIYCSLCSRMRRGILHAVAQRLGCNKIALGHHRDDIIETLLMNMLYAGVARPMEIDLPPEGGAAVIRPLATCGEAELARYAAELGAPILPCNLCGSQPNTRRQRVKALLCTLEAETPGIRENLLAAAVALSRDPGAPPEPAIPLRSRRPRPVSPRP